MEEWEEALLIMADEGLFNAIPERERTIPYEADAGVGYFAPHGYQIILAKMKVIQGDLHFLIGIWTYVAVMMLRQDNG